MENREFEMMLDGYGLTTAQIFYRMPDHRSVIQTFLWQEYDKAPEFDRLYGFLDFWEAELDGPIHSVQYAHQQLIRPGEFRTVEGEFRLH